MRYEVDCVEARVGAQNADDWNGGIIQGMEHTASALVVAHELNAKVGEKLYQVQSADNIWLEEKTVWVDVDEHSWGNNESMDRVVRADGSKDMVAFQEAFSRHHKAMQSGENTIQRMLRSKTWLYVDDYLNQPPERRGLRQALVEVLSCIENHEAIPEALGSMVVSRLTSLLEDQ